jgi:enoyl-CoA hydratase/carnithine racemase
MSGFVRIEKDGPVATLVMDKPASRNAIGEISDCDEFVAALEEINQDAAIRVAILTGAGKAFCAGGDLKMMRERRGIGQLDTPTATRANYRRGVQRIPRAFQDLEVPIIAAINGPAIGLGNDIACLCDVRIAADSAEFAASFIKVGLIPGDGGAWLLPRVIGASKAAELFYTGDRISARGARLWAGVARRRGRPADRDRARAGATHRRQSGARAAPDPAPAGRGADRQPVTDPGNVGGLSGARP